MVEASAEPLCSGGGWLLDIAFTKRVVLASGCVMEDVVSFVVSALARGDMTSLLGLTGGAEESVGCCGSILVVLRGGSFRAFALRGTWLFFGAGICVS